MCVRRRWRGEGGLGCDRVVFTHLLDFLEGVGKEDQRPGTFSRYRRSVAGVRAAFVSRRLVAQARRLSLGVRRFLRMPLLQSTVEVAL